MPALNSPPQWALIAYKAEYPEFIEHTSAIECATTLGVALTDKERIKLQAADRYDCSPKNIEIIKIFNDRQKMLRYVQEHAIENLHHDVVQALAS